jgi:hypothetical protein
MFNLFKKKPEQQSKPVTKPIDKVLPNGAPQKKLVAENTKLKKSLAEVWAMCI